MKMQHSIIAMLCGLIFCTTAYPKDQTEIVVQGFDPGQATTADIQEKRMIQAVEKAAANNSQALFHRSNNPSSGNPNGAITLVEFFDYNCSHCVTMDPLIQSLAQANPNLRVIYKEFPIRGSVSNYAARAALAANLQGKFLSLHSAMMRADNLSDEKINDIAKSLNIDVEKLKSEMSSKTIEQEINENYQLAQRLGITATPAIFVAKTTSSPADTIIFFPGEVDRQSLQMAVNQVK